MDKSNYFDKHVANSLQQKLVELGLPTLKEFEKEFGDLFQKLERD